MQAGLISLQHASEGLFFLSESDFPFTIVQIPLKNKPLEPQLRTLAEKPADTPVEVQEVDYFFRNMVRIYEGFRQEQIDLANRFIQLVATIKSVLKDPKVYRLGERQVDAFIIGKLADDHWGGLRTRLIET